MYEWMFIRKFRTTHNISINFGSDIQYSLKEHMILYRRVDAAIGKT